MMKLLSLMLLVGLPSLVMGAGISAQQPVSLVADESPWDFGCVGIDFDLYHNYKLINNGTDTIRVDSVKTKCRCSSIQFKDSVIAPGSEATVGLMFNTEDYYGPVNKAVRVFYGEGDRAKVVLWWNAVVGQWLYRVKPVDASLFFLPGQTRKESLITNTSLESIKVVSIEPYDSVFTVKATEPTAAKGEDIVFEVIPDPNLKAGTYYSNFRVSIAVPGGNKPLLITIPVKIVRY